MSYWLEWKEMIFTSSSIRCSLFYFIFLVCILIQRKLLCTKMKLSLNIKGYMLLSELFLLFSWSRRSKVKEVITLQNKFMILCNLGDENYFYSLDDYEDLWWINSWSCDYVSILWKKLKFSKVIVGWYLHTRQ